jgi:hypothetical protein
MHAFSLSTAKLDLLRGGKAWTSATSFFYASDGQIFLITNWHVITGVHPHTLRAMNEKTGFLPDAVRIHWKQFLHVGEQTAVQSQSIDLPLYDADMRPLWFEHSKKHSVDLAALLIDLSNFPDWANKAINDIEQEARLTAEVGLDCFILGYPQGLPGPALTPIWKRGSIATEPHPQHVTFLVDSASREGMSGAPVIARHSGIFGGAGPAIADDSVIGTVENFVGIYAGRIGDDQLGFQLGTVWKKDLLEDLISRQTPGLHPLL